MPPWICTAPSVAATAGVERSGGRQIHQVLGLVGVGRRVTVAGGHHLTAGAFQRHQDVRAAVRDRLEAADRAPELVALTGPLHRHRQRARTNSDRIRRDRQQRVPTRLLQPVPHVGAVGEHFPRGVGQRDRADRRGQVERLMSRHVDARRPPGSTATRTSPSAGAAPAPTTPRRQALPRRSAPHRSAAGRPTRAAQARWSPSRRRSAEPRTRRRRLPLSAARRPWRRTATATSSAVTVGTSGTAASALAASSIAAYSSRRSRTRAAERFVDGKARQAELDERRPCFGVDGIDADAWVEQCRHIHLGGQRFRQHLAQLAFVLLGARPAARREPPRLPAVPSPRCDGSPSTVSAMVLR